MANMMDYLDWRGDLTFEASPFNEVDNLILAQLVYVDFEGIVLETGEERAGDCGGKGAAQEGVPLWEASEKFWSEHTKEEILARVSMTKSAAFVMEKMAQTVRFKDIRLWGYVNEISDEEQSQFSVVCVTLPDESIYVAFRGTDNTITGWREDFNMGYLSETPGQLKAVAYMERMIKPEHGVIRVGGHSKGGNLAVYASVKCNEALQDRIIAVYSNDGPGFRRDMIESAQYQKMLPKIHTILPESSIVGMLLEHQEKYEVVRSSHSGIQQHDATSWEVLGASFVYVKEVAAQSLILDEAMKAWLYQLDGEEREQIVDTVFGMLEEANIKTVDDFYNSKWKKVQELMKAKNRLPEANQKLFAKALKLLWKTGNDTVKKNVKQAVMDMRTAASLTEQSEQE